MIALSDLSSSADRLRPVLNLPFPPVTGAATARADRTEVPALSSQQPLCIGLQARRVECGAQLSPRQRLKGGARKPTGDKYRTLKSITFCGIPRRS
jgi:hypothetical protein